MEHAMMVNCIEVVVYCTLKVDKVDNYMDKFEDIVLYFLELAIVLGVVLGVVLQTCYWN
jgi:hypothetical protein